MVKDASPYLSTQWLAMMEAQAQKILDTVPAEKKNAPFSLAEWLTDQPPSDLKGATPKRGFHLQIESGSVRVRAISVLEPADVTIEFPYILAYPLTKLPSGAELDGLVAKSLGEGKIRISGDPSRSPFPDRVLHDAVAQRTL